MAKVSHLYWTVAEDGSAARELISDAEYQLRERERRQRIAEHRRIRERKQVRARRIARVNTIRVTAAVAVLSAFFLSYVYLQASVTASMKHVTALETEISELKAENSATLSRIHTSANLQNVKNTAVNNLGMVYADSSQIVYYTMEDTDYMSQAE